VRLMWKREQKTAESENLSLARADTLPLSFAVTATRKASQALLSALPHCWGRVAAAAGRAEGRERQSLPEKIPHLDARHG